MSATPYRRVPQTHLLDQLSTRPVQLRGERAAMHLALLLFLAHLRQATGRLSANTPPDRSAKQVASVNQCTIAPHPCISVLASPAPIYCPRVHGSQTLIILRGHVQTGIESCMRGGNSFCFSQPCVASSHSWSLAPTNILRYAVAMELPREADQLAYLARWLPGAAI